MKERNLKIIVALMTFTVLALISIQIYWIKNAIDLEEQRFDESVSEAVIEVRESLDKEKATNLLIERFGKKGNNDFFFHFDNNTDTLKNVLNKLKEKNKLIQKKIIKINNSVKGNFEIIARTDTNNKTHKFKFWHGSKGSDSVIISDSLEKIIEEKKKVFSLAFRDFIFNEEKHDFDEDYEEEVDSLLKITLQEKGIKTPFIIDFEEEGEDFFFREDADEHKVFKVRLNQGPFAAKNETVVVQFPEKRSYLLKSMWLVLSLSGFLILTIIVIFYKTINMLIKQKKIAEVKNDIISNITHEFKTPVSTISLAGEALKEESVSADKLLRNKYIEMISFENNRLKSLIDNLLNTASMEKGVIELKIEETELNKLIEETLTGIEEIINKENIILIKKLAASNDKVYGDKFHLKNVFLNLIDNAVKYSNGDKKLIIETFNEKVSIIIKFIDNGIGIPRTHREKIFEAFYRVPKGNIHDVKGHGIGLNYSKRIIESHGGEISLKSKINHGSTFIIKLRTIHES